MVRKRVYTVGERRKLEERRDKRTGRFLPAQRTETEADLGNARKQTSPGNITMTDEPFKKGTRKSLEEALGRNLKDSKPLPPKQEWETPRPIQQVRTPVTRRTIRNSTGSEYATVYTWRNPHGGYRSVKRTIYSAPCDQFGQISEKEVAALWRDRDIWFRRNAASIARSGKYTTGEPPKSPVWAIWSQDEVMDHPSVNSFKGGTKVGTWTQKTDAPETTTRNKGEKMALSVAQKQEWKDLGRYHRDNLEKYA